MNRVRSTSLSAVSSFTGNHEQQSSLGNPDRQIRHKDGCEDLKGKIRGIDTTTVSNERASFLAKLNIPTYPYLAAMALVKQFSLLKEGEKLNQQLDKASEQFTKEGIGTVKLPQLNKIKDNLRKAASHSEALNHDKEYQNIFDPDNTKVGDRATKVVAIGEGEFTQSLREMASKVFGKEVEMMWGVYVQNPKDAPWHGAQNGELYFSVDLSGDGICYVPRDEKKEFLDVDPELEYNNNVYYKPKSEEHEKELERKKVKLKNDKARFFEGGENGPAKLLPPYEPGQTERNRVYKEIIVAQFKLKDIDVQV